MSVSKSVLAGVFVATTLWVGTAWAGESDRGSVIFIHPDGASAATWTAARALLVGPDSDLNWDLLPSIAIYRGHMADSLTATSNGGATTHAFGVKVASNAYGRTAGGKDGRDILGPDGHSASVALQAIHAGIPVGVVQTGAAPEPGTGCFLVSTSRRGNYDEITAGLITSGADVILCGGEKFFLPEGRMGAHGPGARNDDRDLFEEAEAAGYHVVRTREELMKVPTEAKRLLGVFSHDATFHDQSEEELAAAGLPLYEPDAPTVAEMTSAALRIFGAGGQQFMLVVEEEGTDNFGNHNNASGILEAARRADEAIGVARKFVADNPKTLLLTCADSDAGGMRMVGIALDSDEAPPEKLPERSENGSPIDGVAGAGSAPFIAAPDRAGRRLPFGVVWATFDDVSGGVVVRGDGFNSNLIRGSFDNTQVAELMRQTLFGSEE